MYSAQAHFHDYQEQQGAEKLTQSAADKASEKFMSLLTDHLMAMADAAPAAEKARLEEDGANVMNEIRRLCTEVIQSAYKIHLQLERAQEEYILSWPLRDTQFEPATASLDSLEKDDLLQKTVSFTMLPGLLMKSFKGKRLPHARVICRAHVIAKSDS